MKLSSDSFSHEQPIPERCAFCAADPDQHVCLGTNLNPHLSWSDVPEGTKSLVLICHDPDVPAKPDGINTEGKTLSARRKRRDFYHWVLVDIPADAVGVQEGEFSDGVTQRGKPGPASARGTRQGINDYTGWFAGDEAMAGNYFGYDGPCPPWNDTVIHHYHFTLYALDFERCPVGGEFPAQSVLEAIQGHVLETATLTGIYSLNPDVAA
jgi:Raf kinase inhibitor-like YbhB/YbcL family protein